MSRSSTRLGAAGLAAATILTGLALSAAPASAATAAPELPSTVPLVSEWQGEFLHVPVSDARYNDRFRVVAPTREEAVSKALRAEVLPHADGTFALYAPRPDASGAQCFKVTGGVYATSRASKETCAAATVTQMVLHDGLLSPAADPSRYVLGAPGNHGQVPVASSGPRATFFDQVDAPAVSTSDTGSASR